MTEEHYDQREALHAVQQGREIPDWQPVTRWVIRPCSLSRNQWETVESVELENANGEWWDMKRGVSYLDVDVFATEIEARRELEKRLNRLAESLRQHRDSMTKAFVKCIGGQYPL